MKITPFNVFAFFCILSLSAFSQDKLEIKAILERSSLNNLNILKQKVEEDHMSKSTRIESFLSQNNLFVQICPRDKFLSPKRQFWTPPGAPRQSDFLSKRQFSRLPAPQGFHGLLGTCPPRRSGQHHG